MPGVRLDRFVASTALVVLLAGAAGGAFAEPKSGSMEAANPAAATPVVATPPAGASDQSAEKPAQPNETPPATVTTKPQAAAEQPAVAETAKPQAATDQAAPATPAKADGSAEQPTAAAAAGESTEQPAASAAAKPDQSIEQPAAAAATTKPDESAGQSAATAATATTAAGAPVATAPASDQANEQAVAPAPQAPTAGAATATDKQQSVAATGGDEVPAVASASAPTAAPAVVSADAAIADQLRELANGKFDRMVGGKKEREAIDTFYAGRNYAPLWITDGKPNARATAAIAYLGQVDTDGLEPSDYAVPDFTSLADPAALAQAELRLTTSVVTYAHHAAIGRVHWTRVSGDIYYDRQPPAPAEVLAKMADADNVGEALDSYEPHDPAYRALKAKLAELRAGNDEAVPAHISNGPTLKIGMHDLRVPELRTRLAVNGDGDAYDKTLAESVRKFQQEHEIKATGTLTAATVEALNGRRPERPIDTIIANMERWRWMPHDLGKTYVIVNLPDFTLRVMHDGEQVWKTKIVDGKPATPTPIMSAEMKYITVNPTWNVPPSIVAKEYLPALQQDPTVLERMGLTVSTNPDGTIHISQPPGDRNALGRLRFNFPNKFLVYQHDTPDKQLFAYDRRAFSHGCMRVQDPVKYAEVLLSLARPHDGYSEDRIHRMFGNSEVDISFPSFIPVHLTYQTAFVDEEGKLEFRDDIYGRDKALLAILKGDERKVADIPIERRDNTVRREVLALPDGATLWGGRGYGGNFFSRLFGGAFTAPPPAPAPTARRHAARRTEIH